jgi:hypothetical protein
MREALEGSAAAEAASEETEARADDAVERVLERVELPHAGGPEAAPLAARRPELEERRGAGGLRTARVRVVRVGRGEDAVDEPRRTTTLYLAVFRGGVELEVDLDDGVDSELVERAADAGDRVLVEEDPDLGPLIIGVITTRLPETVEIKARKIVLEGEEEIVFRSGTAGMRLREDGDVELVGSRIVTMSRGLFRLVGKMLRLN